MKLKRPMMYKITMILQIVWIIIIVVDVVAIGLDASPIFASEIWGGECQVTVGLGYKITTFYPLSSGDSSAASTTQLNANGLLFGQTVLAVMNIVQGIRFRIQKRVKNKDTA